MQELSMFNMLRSNSSGDSKSTFPSGWWFNRSKVQRWDRSSSGSRSSNGSSSAKARLDSGS